MGTESMFVGEETARSHSYPYQSRTSTRVAASAMRIIRALGRKDALLASGELNRLAALLVRHCDRAIILIQMAAGRIGGPLLFGRLWERLL